MQDRTVRCWGYNGGDKRYLGGYSSNSEVLNPMPVAGLAGVKALIGGDGGTCATLLDGSVRCWGSNYNSQLGMGDVRYQSTPQAISALFNAVKVQLGYNNGFARFADGSLKAWGSNSYNQLGHSNGNTINTPQTVLSGLKGVKQLALGSRHNCALLENGNVQCWGGYSGYGSLGNDSLAGRSSTPVLVKSFGGDTLSGVRELVAGGNHTCAWLGGDQVKCWGYNRFGQVGDGTSDQTDSKDYNRGVAMTVKNL